MSRITGILRALGFLLFTLPLMPVQLLFIGFWPSMGRRFPHAYHRGLCRILGFRPVISGAQLPAGPCLLVGNHVSWIDIVILSAVLPLSFVAKREVARWPLFGIMAKLQGTVFINRERRHSTGKHRDELLERLQGGEAMMLFPEGTSGDGASVRPFKSSFFAAATSDEIAVVPISLAYTHEWNMPLTRRNLPRYAWYGDMDLLPHLWAVLCGGPLRVEVIVHEALQVETARHRKQASAMAEKQVRKGLIEALHGRANMR